MRDKVGRGTELVRLVKVDEDAELVVEASMCSGSDEGSYCPSTLGSKVI